MRGRRSWRGGSGGDREALVRRARRISGLDGCRREERPDDLARRREHQDEPAIVDSPIASERFLQAVDIYRITRRAGVTVRSSVECLIAASAIQHDLDLLHHDRDYDRLSTITPLRARSVRVP